MQKEVIIILIGTAAVSPMATSWNSSITLPDDVPAICYDSSLVKNAPQFISGSFSGEAKAWSQIYPSGIL